MMLVPRGGPPLRRLFLLAARGVGYVLASLVLLACSSNDDTARPLDTGSVAVTESAQPSPATVAPSATATTVPSTQRPSVASGCGLQLPSGVRAGTTAVRTLTSGGIVRDYRLHLPPNYRTGNETAVVLNFHGLGSDAFQQELYSGLVPISDREGFILVSPNGTGAPRAWASFATIPTGTDDVQFTRDLLNALQADLCIDKARVFSTGMSNGAFMSSRLACVLGDRISAIAPVAGVFFPTEPCGKPVPILVFHGTMDRTVPYNEGLIFGVLPYAGVSTYADGWAKHNGCLSTSDGKAMSEHVSKETFISCKGAQVAVVTIMGGGHTWPGAAIEIGRPGETTKEISAAEEIWKFFASR